MVLESADCPAKNGPALPKALNQLVVIVGAIKTVRF
jgi:hypothetical protein